MLRVWPQNWEAASFKSNVGVDDERGDGNRVEDGPVKLVIHYWWQFGASRIQGNATTTAARFSVIQEFFLSFKDWTGGREAKTHICELADVGHQYLDSL